MAQQVVNSTDTPNQGRTKWNANDTELYSLVGGGGGTISGMPTVSTVAALRALTSGTTFANGDHIYLKGYSSTDDGGQGFLYYDNTAPWSITSVNTTTNQITISGTVFQGQPIVFSTTGNGVTAGVTYYANVPAFAGSTFGVAADRTNAYKTSGMTLQDLTSTGPTGTVAEADDGGMCFVDAAGRRWRRLVQGEEISIKWFGAVGNDTGDQGPAINAAIAASYGRYDPYSNSSRVVYFPVGLYRVTTPLEFHTYMIGTFPGYVRMKGQSQRHSVIHWAGSAANMVHIQQKSHIIWEYLHFLIAGQDNTRLFRIWECFTIDFFKCDFTGTHGQGDNGTDLTAARWGQECIEFALNSGDSHILACNFQNFGVGIRTSSTMNYINETDLTGCGTNILFSPSTEAVAAGDMAGIGGGLTISNCTNNGSDRPGGALGLYLYAIHVPAEANNIFITGMWSERTDNGVKIGSSGQSPMQFSLKNSQINAKAISLHILSGQRNCLDTVLVSEDVVGPGPWTDMTIASGSFGAAINVHREDNAAIASRFSANWSRMNTP